MDPSYNRTLTSLVERGGVDVVRAGVQADAKAVAVVGSGGFLAVVRTLRDGGLDPSFGSGGRFIYRPSSTWFSPSDAVVGPDGTIVVVGTSNPGGVSDLVVLRITPAGALDETFADGGVFTRSTPYGFPYYQLLDAVAVLADGSVVAAANTYGQLLVFRLTPDGELDPTFSDDGIGQYTSFGAGFLIHGIAVDSAGSAVVTGEVLSDARQDVFVARITAAGELDASFNGDGLVVDDFTLVEGSPSDDVAYDLVVESDRSITLAVESWVSPLGSGGDDGLQLVRYAANGTRVDAYGRQLLPLGVGFPAVQMQRRGSGFVVSGAYGSANDGAHSTATAAFDATGRRDTSFGDNGVVVVNVVDGQAERGLAVLLDDGRLLLVNDAGSNDLDDRLSIARLRVYVPPAPPPPAPSSPTPSVPPPPSRSGYWMVGQTGDVYAFGDARWHGALNGARRNVVDIEPTVSGNGYWLLTSVGEIYTYGDARHVGQPSGLVAGESVTSMSANPTGAGYWVFTTKGRVFAYGGAPHKGDMFGRPLNGPVLDSVPTPSGNGYYMVAADGGIFTFGDAVFHGSMGGKPLNGPVQSLVPDGDGVGYWLVATDGGTFSFAADFHGSMGGRPLNKPMTGMVRFGDGYLMVAEDGGIFNFSNKAFYGSLGSNPPASPVVAVAALDR